MVDTLFSLAESHLFLQLVEAAVGAAACVCSGGGCLRVGVGRGLRVCQRGAGMAG